MSANHTSLTPRDVLAATDVTATTTTHCLTSGPAEGATPSRRRRSDVHHHTVPDAKRRWAADNGLPPQDWPTLGRWAM
jgi:hypothetical protein